MCQGSQLRLREHVTGHLLDVDRMSVRMCTCMPMHTFVHKTLTAVYTHVLIRIYAQGFTGIARICDA